MSYTYDGDGKRVKKSNGKLYWYGMSSDPLVETDLSGNNPTEYVFFGGKRIARRDSSETVYYFFADHLGTARVMTNSTGVTQQESTYYPFGGEQRVITNLTLNTYKFTGKERDSETQNDYFGARFHASNLGRFMSPDPGPFLWTDPQTLNRYAYTRNNPVRYTDPTGRYFVVSPSDQHYSAFVNAIKEMLLTPSGREAVRKIMVDPRPSFFNSGTIEQQKGKVTPGITQPIAGTKGGPVAGTTTTVDFSRLREAREQQEGKRIDLQGKDTTEHETAHVVKMLGASTLQDAIKAGVEGDQPKSMTGSAEQFAEQVQSEYAAFQSGVDENGELSAEMAAAVVALQILEEGWQKQNNCEESTGDMTCGTNEGAQNNEKK